jgi:hypothetical protein
MKNLRASFLSQGVYHYAALTNSGIKVSLDGRRVEAPPSLIQPNGIADLSSYV